MQGFLQRTAVHILTHYGDHTGELCVVLPNRRAALFLRQHLAAQAGKTIWAPEIFSIEDFVQELCGLQKVDNLSLLFELYAIHRKEKGAQAEAFDEFTRWAQVFIQDINELDRYLVDTRQLFGNLMNVKEIENWSLSKEELTDFQRQYLDFFTSLGGLYEKLKEQLLSKKQVYEGLAFRLAWEQLDEKIGKQRWHKILFAGFNALNTAEERIMEALVQRGLAEVLWDCDAYYMNDTRQEAGKFLRRLIPKFRREKEAIKWQEEDLLRGAKKITVIGAARQVAQAKTAAAILEGLNLSQEELKRTALVLADENLLFPVLHSLPAYIEQVNVTMGYPLKNTPFAGLSDILFNLHEFARQSEKEKKAGISRFYHRELLKFLSHPYVKFLFAEPGFLTRLRRAIIERNYVFVSVNDLQHFLGEEYPEEMGTLKKLLSPWGDAAQALDCFGLLIDLLRTRFSNEKERASVETEYLFGFSKVFKRLRTLLAEYQHSLTLKTFHSLLRQVSAASSLPFYGEPLSGLQVMGVLETRTLDFDNVILLSVNEHVLPAARTQHSFIPLDLKKAFGLATYSDKDAVFAYHFYRLLQRAKNIYLLYNTETDELGKGEKSRFITQLLYELPKVNPNVLVEEKLVVTENQPPDYREEIVVEKSEEVLELLGEKAAKGLSPSALNTYKKCSLQFYFRHVAGLKEREEVEETIGADTLGTAIHRVLEELYTPFKGRVLHAADLEGMKNNVEALTEKALSEEYSSHELRSGKNLLTFRIAVKFVRNFLEAERQQLEQIHRENKQLTILDLELPLEMNLHASGRNVMLKGNTDRVDRISGITRIIDYKTGKAENKELYFEDWEEIRREPLLNKSFQLLVYALLYSKQAVKNEELVSGIITFRELSAGLKTVKVAGNELLGEGVLQRFEKELILLLEEIFDRGRTFSQTDDLAVCGFCSFRAICNR